MGVFPMFKYGLYPENIIETPLQNVVQYHLTFSLISLVAQDNKSILYCVYMRESNGIGCYMFRINMN